jgi:membrane associated rhomboid family serine protease
MDTTQPEKLQTSPTGEASLTKPVDPATPLTLDGPTPRLRDWLRCATIVIIALNVVVFLIMVLQGVSLFSPTAESVLKWGADYGPLTLHGQWWRMVVSTFLHFGLIHLLFNVFVLFNIGLFMEDLAGRVEFIVLYLVCGLGGSAASLAWHPSTVSAGASGAIFGLYGALLGFLVVHRGSIPAESLASLRKGALTFIGYNLLYGLRPGVDMAAHVGGLATGFVLGLFLIQAPASSSSSSGSGEMTASADNGLTPASNWRVPTAVVLGLVLIVAPMIALPKPDDYLAEYRRLAAIEEKDIELFNASLKQWQAGQINGQQYADILEKQILPPWRAERKAIEKLSVSQDQAARKRLLVEYLTDREQSWQLTVDGVRADDTGKLGQAAQKSAEAEKVAARLRGR